jgi:xanthine dehydrogenase accessory factor
MTEVVQAIRLGGLTAAGSGPAARPNPEQAVDPVCGMTVTVTPDALHALVDGRDYWFCGPGCLAHFTAAA